MNRYLCYLCLTLLGLSLLMACNTENARPNVVDLTILDELNGPPPPRSKADTTTPFEGAMRQALQNNTSYYYWQPQNEASYQKGDLILSMAAIKDRSTIVLVEKGAKPWKLDNPSIEKLGFAERDSSQKNNTTWNIKTTSVPGLEEFWPNSDVFRLFWNENRLFYRYLQTDSASLDFTRRIEHDFKLYLKNETGETIAELSTDQSGHTRVIKLSWKNQQGQEISLRYATVSMSHGPGMRKPILYLYPPQAQNIKVNLDLDGQITHSYPRYPAQAGGWEVQAQPNGDLTDLHTGKQYYALYWEAEDQHQFRAQEGFVVKGEDTEVFLDNILAEIGLNRREAQEFVMYWLPELEANPYNLIHFATEEYSLRNRLNISPKPDALLRLLMVYTPLSKPIEIAPQRFPKFERKGFTAVEWGGKGQARLLN